jgi:alkylhydroperoxidase/carboxymuconolactone decarboxylase family protein YurZ
VLARPFLGIGEREIMAVAMLAALDQERELRAHAKGALRVGVPAALVRAALAGAEEGAGRELAPARKVVEGALS